MAVYSNRLMIIFVKVDNTIIKNIEEFDKRLLNKPNPEVDSIIILTEQEFIKNLQEDGKIFYLVREHLNKNKIVAL